MTTIPHRHAGILSQPPCCARRASSTMCTGHAAADFLRAKHHLTGMAGCQATCWLISFSQRILKDASAPRCGSQILRVSGAGNFRTYSKQRLIVAEHNKEIFTTRLGTIGTYIFYCTQDRTGCALMV